MSQLSKIAEERERIINTIRFFFRARNFTEVETPILVRSPDIEPSLSHFETELFDHTGKKYEGALITSPEYAMKKLLGSGMDRIFTMTKVFRNNEELGRHHNPEFSMLEWYRQNANYQHCMDETEALVKEIVKPFAEGSLRWTNEFRRIRMRDLFIEHFKIDLDTASTEDLRKACLDRNLKVSDDDMFSDLFYRLFIRFIEPKLSSEPTFVYDYPKSQAALAQLTPDKKYAERFELYIDGLELCNGFTELTDAREQKRRFQKEAERRKRAGKKAFPIDEELLELLPSIHSPTYGNALGIDRLHMVATGKRSIEEVLLFPANKIFK